MWCQHCGQDVPGFATAPGGQPICARCGHTLQAAGEVTEEIPAGEGTETADHGIAIASRPPLELDDWELEAELALIRGRTARFDAASTHAPHAGLTSSSIAALAQAGIALSADREAARRNRPQATGGSAARVSLVAWSVLSVGFMGIVCGAVLLGWSWLADRPELWQLGIPFAVVGQVGLLLGLVLQIERAWQGSRDAASKLEHVDQELHQLKNTATMLGVSHGTASQAFYSHMAEGASPQLLLADLKGQLDLLSLRMSQQKP